jgi:CopG family transcriptional regulator, nickel-responsive regulator
LFGLSKKLITVERQLSDVIVKVVRKCCVRFMAEIISFSIPEESIGEIEKLQEKLGLKGRSELIRAALRSLTNETTEHSKLNGTVNAVLIVTHAHNDSLEELIHKFDELVKTHMHQHVGKKCVELFLLDGKAEKIRNLYNALLKNKHVLGTKLVVV